MSDEIKDQVEEVEYDPADFEEDYTEPVESEEVEQPEVEATPEEQEATDEGLDSHTKGILRELIRTRDRAQQAEWQAQQKEEELARYRQALEQKSKDDEEDLTPWERQAKEIQDLKALLIEREQNEEIQRRTGAARQATLAVKEAYNRQHEEFVKENPDFDEAAAHLLRIQYGELIDRGMDDATAQQAMLVFTGRDMFNVVSKGGNFAQYLYERSKRYGYKPGVAKEAKPNGRQAPPSLSKIPGGTKPGTKTSELDYLQQIREAAADIHNPSRFERLAREGGA